MTHSEIRSKACNTILIGFVGFATLALESSLVHTPSISVTADLVPEHEHIFRNPDADLVIGKPVD